MTNHNPIDHVDYQVNELGKIEIAPEVIQIISGLAAQQVEGVAGLSGGVVGDLTQLLGRKNLRQGVRVEVGDETKIEVAIVIAFGYHIPEVGRNVQAAIKSAVENMTGLNVSEVVVRVEAVKFSTDKQTDAESHRVK